MKQQNLLELLRKSIYVSLKNVHHMLSTNRRHTFCIRICKCKYLIIFVWNPTQVVCIWFACLFVSNDATNSQCVASLIFHSYETCNLCIWSTHWCTIFHAVCSVSTAAEKQNDTIMVSRVSCSLLIISWLFVFVSTLLLCSSIAIRFVCKCNVTVCQMLLLYIRYNVSMYAKLAVARAKKKEA